MLIAIPISMSKVKFLLILSVFALAACSEGETYADQKNREQDIIQAFASGDTHIVWGGEELCHVGPITYIEESEFLKDTVTRCELDADGNYIHNEYVRLNTGVLMQIVRRGVGDMLTSGQSCQLAVRYFEYNMSTAYVTSRNTIGEYHRFVDIINVSNSYGTLTGSFSTENGGGAMYRTYSSTVVPEGWFAPLRYVRIGNQMSPDEGIAKVRLIVPHSLGHSLATSNVHPYFYELTFEKLH